MGLHELSADQKSILKQRYLCLNDKACSWSDLADADSLVTDKQLEEEFGHINFVEEDF